MRQAWSEAPPGAFRLRRVAADMSAPHVLAAALALEIIVSDAAGAAARGRDATTATRLITHNIELSREDKAEARRQLNQKRGAARVEREAAREKVEGEQRRKRDELDAVWDAEDD